MSVTQKVFSRSAWPEYTWTSALKIYLRMSHPVSFFSLQVYSYLLYAAVKLLKPTKSFSPNSGIVVSDKDMSLKFYMYSWFLLTFNEVYEACLVHRCHAYVLKICDTGSPSHYMALHLRTDTSRDQCIERGDVRIVSTRSMSIKMILCYMQWRRAISHTTLWPSI